MSGITGGQVHAFDLDHTLIRANASFQFGLFLYRQGIFGALKMLHLLRYYASHKAFGTPIFDLHQRSFRALFLGRDSHEMSQHVDTFLDETLVQLWYAPAVSRLRDAQNAQHVTAIFSSSPDFLVKPIARRLGVHHWAASQYAVDHKGLFSSVDKVLEGSDKATLLHDLVRQWEITPSESIAYSDSHLDLPFLQAAGRAIVVNPDRKLKAISLQKAWEII